ncbi:piggyBac transposable element-derived protein 4-like [Ctenocephalides felis]|uniref:piggyBac transposable element-derived protein 4-like n=1 Tax=Ctenocephalides felis TaxID=7515 RepID=UPI000E6E560D|nr:piggyBac transposable element-derived protein 4-like [Ctenocephalides felis]
MEAPCVENGRFLKKMALTNDPRRILEILEESDEDQSNSTSDAEVEDHLSERSNDSGTEQQVSDSDADSDSSSNLDLLRLQSQQNRHVFKGRDGTLWQKTPARSNVRTRSENIISDLPGVRSVARNAKTIFESWSLFITDDILNTIQTCTNLHIQERRALCADLSKHRYMEEIEISELKAFIGLLYIAGFYRSNKQNLSDLWQVDGTGVEIFRLTMSIQRFYFIQSCLRFDDKSTRAERQQFDNLAPIRNIFEMFVQQCQKMYSPGENCTIDEMLVAFRGRCKFRQYIPSKPAKYGIKIFALVDASTYYVTNLEIYSGKQPSGPYSLSNKPFDVVNRVVLPVSKSHRNITFDNWFTSYELVSHLLTEHKLTAVGTLRKNKRQIPPQFITTRGKCPGSSTFGHQKDITLVSYIPKKNKVVLLMSSLHHDEKIDESTGDKRKPDIISFYNHTKSGVDVVDNLSASYNVSRNTKRWPLTIFFAMLNISEINANIIYRANNDDTRMKRRHFLKNLGLAMVQEHLQVRRARVNLPRQLRKRIAQFTGETTDEPPRKILGVRKRCQICPSKKDKKTSHTCHECQIYICPDHFITYCNNCSSSMSVNEEIED